MSARRKKMLVICPHPENRVPGQRLKYEQYFQHWREHGYELTVMPFYSNRMQDILYQKGHVLEKIYWVLCGYLQRLGLIFRLKQYDLIYIFLWVTPIGPPIMERIYTLLNRNLVYDIDDAIFLKADSIFNRWVQLLKGRRKPFFMMKAAREVIACTPYLTEVVRQLNPRVTDISSTINTQTYQPVNQYRNDHRLVLGWSGSHSTARFLHLLHPVLLELKKTHDFSLLVMGEANFNMEGIDTEAIAWSEADEIRTLQRMDIGLYPLPAHDEWVLGKSGLKALQYMAVGIPVVATAVGANFRIMESGKTGWLVNHPEEWLQQLRYLMDHPEIRRSTGLAGRAHVEAHYSIRATAPVYLAILNRVSR